METVDIKQRAHELIDELPEGATWKDLIYEMYVRQEIEAGLEDSMDGQIQPVEEVRKEFGLMP
jgi:hypothetical protein